MCTRPYKGFQIGLNPSGAPKFKLCSKKVDHVELIGSTWNASNIPMKSSLATRVVRESIDIPCGKCPECRLAYAKQWATRCIIEMQDHESTLFLTLTYDDEHVPMSAYGDPDTGEARQCMTLKKTDWQKFMKRLRSRWEFDGHKNKLRFLAAGEYGARTMRPHYHAIIFGLSLTDLEPYGVATNGSQFYTSAWISEIWPYGNVVIGEANFATCAYTAQYTLKKAFADVGGFCEAHNIEREFILMSRRPGLGASRFRPELYDYNCMYVPTANGAQRAFFPRFYDKLLDKCDHVLYTKVKEQRMTAAKLQTELELLQTDLDEVSYLAVKDRAACERAKRAERSL